MALIFIYYYNLLELDLGNVGFRLIYHIINFHRLAELTKTYIVQVEIYYYYFNFLEVRRSGYVDQLMSV